jgi:hypothetical protein
MIRFSDLKTLGHRTADCERLVALRGRTQAVAKQEEIDEYGRTTKIEIETTEENEDNEGGVTRIATDCYYVPRDFNHP